MWWSEVPPFWKMQLHFWWLRYWKSSLDGIKCMDMQANVEIAAKHEHCRTKQAIMLGFQKMPTAEQHQRSICKLTLNGVSLDPWSHSLPLSYFCKKKGRKLGGLWYWLGDRDVRGQGCQVISQLFTLVASVNYPLLRGLYGFRHLLAVWR